RNRQMERKHLDVVTRPLNRLSSRGHKQIHHVIERSGGRMLARYPLRVKKREFTWFDVYFFADMKDISRRLARVKIKHDDRRTLGRCQRRKGGQQHKQKDDASRIPIN